MSTDTRALQRLAEVGQSVWIDYLSRDLLESGELARLVREDAVVGVTSNPTIFEHAISAGDAYDAQLRELLPRPLSGKDVFLELACADVAAGCDLLRPVWEQQGGRDGYVSIEVDPTLAYDAVAQYEEARHLHERIDRPNLLVKIPATKPGVTAIADSIAQRHARLLDRALRRRCTRVSGRARTLPRRRRRPVARALRRKLLRLPCRQRDRPAPRRPRRTG
jgi:hypothetical protein